MIFKEWFKNPADEKAREQAVLLGKIARLKLREEKDSPMFDSLISDEMKADILFNHPKTNDDDMCEYAAGTLITNSYEYEKVSGGQDLAKDFIEDTAKIMVHELKKDREVITEQEKELLDLKQELFISERRLADAQTVLIQYSKPAFAQQDEFHLNRFKEAEQLVQDIESEKKKLETRILALEERVKYLESRYKSGLDQYYAITGELMPDEQERIEQQN